ncbi:MAG: hypothetical protein A2Y94_15210 [Caldithrix sp. RBG_13_44_9]|nr:MAG: hypothetical protein A2Y94_15210 [Caldithrix sp. RBG_13_44_9]
MDYLLIFLLSIITSAASATVGLGGGLLLIPFIVIIFDLPLRYVAGTMLLAMIPYAGVATIRNLKNRYINFKIGLTMEFGSIPGVFLGAYFSSLFPDLMLKILFLSVAAYLMLTLQIPANSPYNYVSRGFNKFNFIPPFITCRMYSDNRCSIPLLTMVGIIAGFFSGLLGIGGGFVNTPILIVAVGLPPKLAVGTSLFMILITAFFGTVEHAYLSHIHYELSLIIAVGMTIGAYAGAVILEKVPEEKIKKYLFIAMFVAGVLTFFR